MIKKKLSPNGKSVRVTFELPAEVAKNTVAVVGDFNAWNGEKNLMKLNPQKGIWSTGISFKPGETIQFRYFIDGNSWLNDEAADRYDANPFAGENSVLVLS